MTAATWAVWPWTPSPLQMQNCDIDAAPNGTVGYLAVRTADVGQATITGQQGSVANSTRQTNVNFIGEPAAGLVPTISLYAADMSALPALVSPLQQVNVTAVVLNQALNPLAGMTVTCTVSPVSGLFSLLSDRDTTGADGMAHFTLVPTGLPGTAATLSCSLDSYPNIPPATHEFTVSLTPTLESVALVSGLQPDSRDVGRRDRDRDGGWRSRAGRGPDRHLEVRHGHEHLEGLLALRSGRRERPGLGEPAGRHLHLRERGCHGQSTSDLGLVAGCGVPDRAPTPCGLQRS